MCNNTVYNEIIAVIQTNCYRMSMEGEVTLMRQGNCRLNTAKCDDTVVVEYGWDEALPLLTGRVLNRARQECALRS